MSDTDKSCTRRFFLKNSTIAAGVLAAGIHLLPQEEVMAAQDRTDRNAGIFASGDNSLAQTDPEFADRFDYFAFTEVPEHGPLDARTRYMAILATLLGCQGMDAWRLLLPAALDNGVKPEEVKEIVYQAVAYLGIGRVYPFFYITNEIMQAKGIKLPLAPQGGTTLEDRLQKGNQAQFDIFGSQMREFWKNGPADTSHIRLWLAANCFGDYYTRGALDLREREMITFCYIMAQGGCESQLTSHARGNMRMGNDKEFLIAVISQCVPYIGYPRSLNAISCVETAAKSS